MAKGGFMLAFGLGVLGEAAYKAFHPVMPGVEVMGVIGVLAGAAEWWTMVRSSSEVLRLGGRC